MLAELVSASSEPFSAHVGVYLPVWAWSICLSVREANDSKGEKCRTAD